MTDDSSSRLPKLLSRAIEGTVARYAIAIIAALAALVLRDVLNPFLGPENPYHTAWLAVVLAARYCGVGPAIVAVIVDAGGVWYFFSPPQHSFAGGFREVSGLVGFLLFSAVIIALGESTRRNIATRQQAEEELRRIGAVLEKQVQERTTTLAQKTAEVVEKAALLDATNDAIFVKTAAGEISFWNQGAERLYGWSMSEALGRVPGELLRSQYPIPLRDIENTYAWEGELHQTTRDGRQIVVASRWTMLRDSRGETIGWMEINTDITGRKRAEDAARSLSGRILSLQDDERRRIARGLHDSLGQYLAALKMQIDLLSTANANESTLLAECSDIANRCLTETRTISHLLHPPLLDEAGFGSAARWFVDGFAQRSGISANLSLPPDLGRMQADLEIALFRSLQEGLTNVHRHSRATAVDISLERNPKQVRLQIRDNGQGMSSLTLQHLIEGGAETGIGIAGMRERARELGGSLEIESDSTGTSLRIALPLSHAAHNGNPEKQNGPQAMPAA